MLETMTDSALAEVVGGTTYYVYAGKALVGKTTSFSGVAALKKKAALFAKYAGLKITVRTKPL